MQFNKSMRIYIIMHSRRKLKVSISKTRLFFIIHNYKNVHFKCINDL